MPIRTEESTRQHTALSRASRTRAVVLAGAWREAVANLAAVVDVCREIEADEPNGDAALARAIRQAVAVEVDKIESRLTSLPVARPPEPGQGEAVDEEHMEKVRVARAEPDG